MYFSNTTQKLIDLDTTFCDDAREVQERIGILESLINKAEFLLSCGNPTSEEITNWKIDCDSIAGFNFLKEKSNG